MGCDIHLGIQIKFDPLDQHWYWGAQDVYVARNYELFGHLAGIRGDADPIVEPRGWPLDSGTAENAVGPWWGEHTTSYLTVKELDLGLPASFKQDPWYQCAKAFASEYGADRTRIVFNFDS